MKKERKVRQVWTNSGLKCRRISFQRVNALIRAISIRECRGRQWFRCTRTRNVDEVNERWKFKWPSAIRETTCLLDDIAPH